MLADWNKLIYLLFLSTLSCQINITHSSFDGAVPNETELAVQYLKNYGYMSEPHNTSHLQRSWEDQHVKKALRKFQEFYGLQASGELDQASLQLMKTRTCGVPDLETNNSGPRTMAQMGKFGIRDITWAVSRVAVITRQEFEVVMRNAGAAWTSITNLRFSQKKSGTPHIMASFQPNPHQADGERSSVIFVSPGHAVFPKYSGDNSLKYVHLNKEWKGWNDYNVLTITVHEIGHCLGLVHTGGRLDIMNPGASRLPCNMKHTDTVCFSDTDKRNIQEKYGPPSNGSKKKKKNKGRKNKNKQITVPLATENMYGTENLKWQPGKLGSSFWNPGKWSQQKNK